MRIDVYIHQDLGEISKLAQAIQHMEETMSAEFDDLKAKVASNTAVTASAVTLIQGINQRIIT